ncbi:MAG: hypothetical protein VX730_06520 [Pseudomonadota bacterium]|nr:hypothetical protein [Pseudomonadota bacterium]
MTRTNMSPQVAHLMELLEFGSDNIFMAQGRKAAHIRTLHHLGVWLKRQGDFGKGFFTPAELIERLGYTVKVVGSAFSFAMSENTDGSATVYTGLTTEDLGGGTTPCRNVASGEWEPDRQSEVKGAAIQAMRETLLGTTVREMREETAVEANPEQMKFVGVALVLKPEHNTIYVVHYYFYAMTVEEMDSAIAAMKKRRALPEDQWNPEEDFETYGLVRRNLLDLDLPRMFRQRNEDAKIDGLPVAHRKDRVLLRLLYKHARPLYQQLMQNSKADPHDLVEIDELLSGKRWEKKNAS